VLFSINDHGPRVGYRLNTAKGKILLGRCNTLAESTARYQAYRDFHFEPSAIAVHPNNSPDPATAALIYCSKLLGSYIGSDSFITHALTQQLHQADLQAQNSVLIVPSRLGCFSSGPVFSLNSHISSAPSRLA